VQIHETARDGETDPGPAARARVARIRLPEQVERVGAFRLAHADARVGDAECNSARRIARHREQRATARRRELDGVRQERKENVAHRARIAAKAQRFGGHLFR
jgi:hypothetical protein